MVVAIVNNEKPVNFKTIRFYKNLCLGMCILSFYSVLIAVIIVSGL